MIEVTKKMQEQLDKMCLTGKLFRSNITGQQIWDLYLNSFDSSNNPKFRDPESSSHNCNHCKNFIRRYGNIVAIDENYKIITLFDIEVSEEYSNSIKEMSKALKSASIQDVFFETFAELNSLPYETCSKSNALFQLGVDRNHKRYTKEEAEKFGVVKENQTITFNHFYLKMPKQFVDQSNKSEAALISEFRDAKNVFRRGLELISMDTFQLVKDLINQGSLLNGETHLYKIEQMIPFKAQFDSLAEADRDNWCWVNSYKLPFAKFKNELIGTLCSELAEGEELNKACQAWNKRVDPVNYMKTTAPITKRQIEEAQKFVEENGYVDSFNRRFATIKDIKASEILHLNSGSSEIKSVSLFDSIKPAPSRHKRNEFDGVEEVQIEKFMKDILPGCQSVEVFLKSSHESNMCNLITSAVENSKPIFKYSNNYSKTFNGNIAGNSQIKEAVKSAGGKVDGVLRFSIMWSGDRSDNSDLDAWCYTPSGNRIYYNCRLDVLTQGNLDVDITQPLNQMPSGAVENITFPSLQKLTKGTYKFCINQFSARNSRGFKAEIEFNGELYSYEYTNPVSGTISVAAVTFDGGEFNIQHNLPVVEGLGVTKEIYGLETNMFHKVNLLCLSPNYWGDNAVGNKHYMFMLEGCKAVSAVRSFHNEDLIPELAGHRRVLEVLGTKAMIESKGDQLAGLGFNATVRDELIVRLTGNFKRIIKIKF